MQISFLKEKRRSTASYSGRNQAATHWGASVPPLTILYICVGELYCYPEAKTPKMHQLWGPNCYRSRLPGTCYRDTERTWLEQDWENGNGAWRACHIPTRTWRRSSEVMRSRITRRSDVSARETRATVDGRLEVPRARTEFARRSFCVRAVRAWNELPGDVRRSSTFATFKDRLTGVL